MFNFAKFKLGLVVAGGLLFCAAPAFANPMVVNGDFETDTEGFTAWPGYTGGEGVNPANITGWTGDGGRGINPIASPHDNPAPFNNGANDTHIAFLQGTAHIEQVISGFTVGNEYTLSLDFNARNCCGDSPIGTVLLNNQVVASSADLFPDPGAVIPTAADEPWYHADIDFVADAADITLRIETMSAAGGDSTLIVDNVSIVPEPSAGILLLLGVACFASGRRRRA